jgi:hypothetical protein
LLGVSYLFTLFSKSVIDVDMKFKFCGWNPS